MSAPPSGTVTFLFTDIEGSTRLLKQLRDGYAAVVAEHQRLLRAGFAAHGGYEVDTQGDSFFVAFASAREAVLAAVEGQLALAAHEWPDGVQVKVRMGLHTGRAFASDGHYTGLAVHRAARVGSAGHGGQVLVSQATQTLLEDEEEDLGVFLRDLGEQQLKDLDRPVRLYQAVADGLPTTFPPLRPAAELAPAAQDALAPPPPLYRRPLALAAAAIAAAFVLAGAFLGTRWEGGGLSAVKPNHVGVIDPETNDIVAEVPVGLRPGPIAVGRGSIWVANVDDRTLTRIDPRQRTAAGTVSLENRTPTGIAVGAGGVWVAHARLGQLSRVDPEFNQVTKAIDVAARSSRGSVAVGDGAVWAVYGDSTIARIDAGGARVDALGYAGAEPAAIVVGLGDVWVANSGEGDSTVTRYRPSTFAGGPVDTVSVGRRPTGIAFGDRAIWVANSGEDTVTKIDPDTGVRTIGVGEEPTAVAVGEGAVWVANTAAGTISRIDPATNEVVATIELGSAPAGIAVGNGFVWVTAQTP